jgi:Leucine-rich repeat (LRR) protein
MVNAQKWLEESYKSDAIKISARGKELAGELDFKNFSKLEYVDLSKNEIIKLSNLPDTLRDLSVQKNPLEQDIKGFAHLVNLETINFNDTKTHGNLKEFTNLVKLERLFIGNSNITGNPWLLPELAYWFFSNEVSWVSLEERSKKQLFVKEFIKEKQVLTTQKAQLEKDHANCAATIQTLTNQRDTLQNQMNALLGIPQMEAKVQQTDLPPTK